MLQKKKKEEGVSETVKTVVYAVLIAVLIRSFFIEPFRIPSGSMYPTLEVGDYLFVTKYTYGYSRHSFPASLIPFEGRFWESRPERGDIVVFKFPGDNKKDYIKRVIGLPGDTIEVKKGRLYINDKMVERKEIGSYEINEFTHKSETYTEYEETLPNGVKHLILEASDYEPIVDNTTKVTVPEGHFFAMGDNRDRSDDSRISVGFVPFENLVGKARFLFFSHNDKGAWYKPWTWFEKIRWSKFFNVLN